MAATLPRACIIGTGCSGFTTAKRLKDEGVPFDCFELSDDVGGNWYYKNPNGRSACYQSLHIDTSKWRLAFEDFPVPSDWPDFPHHSQLQQYFRDYVDHFGLRPMITFNTEVTRAERDADGLWQVTLSTGETRTYDVLFICNGHHWDPRIPDYPGHFDGTAFHVHSYRTPFDPVDVRGKTVVVVGMGNSAMDVASELAQRPIAGKLVVSARRGVWVLPKYMDGRVADKAVMPAEAQHQGRVRVPIEGRRVETFQPGDGLGNPLVQFGKGGFGVRKDGRGLTRQPGRAALGPVAGNLHLPGQGEHVRGQPGIQQHGGVEAPGRGAFLAPGQERVQGLQGTNEHGNGDGVHCQGHGRRLSSEG